MKSIEARIGNLSARLRGQTNKYKYGAGDPMTIVHWLRAEATVLEREIVKERATAELQRRLEL